MAEYSIIPTIKPGGGASGRRIRIHTEGVYTPAEAAAFALAILRTAQEQGVRFTDPKEG